MDFEQIHIKNSSDLQIFHSRNLSRNLIIELESNPVNVSPTNQFSTYSTQNVFVWITLLGMISCNLFEIIRELGTVKVNKGLRLSWLPDTSTQKY